MYFKIENPRVYRAALYIRLSKEDENEGPSQSVTNQQSLLNEFVRQQGLSVWETYIDDGWSGTSFERPAFRRMIGDIEAGCEASLNPARLLPIAREAVEQAWKENSPERESQEVQRRIDRLTANLDQMYRDRLNGLLAETDFERMYHTLQLERRKDIPSEEDVVPVWFSNLLRGPAPAGRLW